MTLKTYHKKRKFTQTPEPFGTEKNTNSTQKKFVVQLHHARRKHYDLRLENNGVLVSWAVPKGLSMNPTDKRLAVLVEDHPLDYINFEGIIPKGNYGAGTVEIFDKGTYLSAHNFDASFKKGHIKITLFGEKLRGAFNLVRTSENNWIIIKEADEFIVTKPPKKSKLPFKTCLPMLATLSGELPKGKDWVYEIKYDGYRALAFVENQKAKLLSRNQKCFSKRFGGICQSLSTLPAENFVLDGEIVAFDPTGRTDFSLLQTKLKSGETDLYFVVFDLLAINGEDVRSLPLLRRKAKLERLLFNAPPNIIFSQHVENGEKCWQFAKTHNLEGIVAKKNTVYTQSRSLDWIKIKCVKRQEFVVCGFTTTIRNPTLSALVMGVYNQKKLVFVGKVGSGLTEAEKSTLSKKLLKLKRKTSPFLVSPNLKNVVWVTPKLLAEVEFTELTKDRIIRQGRYIGLREDKLASEVKLEGDYEEN